MKKTKTGTNQKNRKLRVNREAIAVLTPNDLEGVAGGAGPKVCVHTGSNCPD